MIFNNLLKKSNNTGVPEKHKNSVHLIGREDYKKKNIVLMIHHSLEHTAVVVRTVTSQKEDTRMTERIQTAPTKTAPSLRDPPYKEKL